MKAIIEFSLPEEHKEHLRAVKATDMAIVLFDIVYNLRKEAEQRMTDGKELDIVFDIIEEWLTERGIIIDDIIE